MLVAGAARLALPATTKARLVGTETRRRRGLCHVLPHRDRTAQVTKVACCLRSGRECRRTCATLAQRMGQPGSDGWCAGLDDREGVTPRNPVRRMPVASCRVQAKAAQPQGQGRDPRGCVGQLVIWALKQQSCQATADGGIVTLSVSPRQGGGD